MKISNMLLCGLLFSGLNLSAENKNISEKTNQNSIIKENIETLSFNMKNISSCENKDNIYKISSEDKNTYFTACNESKVGAILSFNIKAGDSFFNFDNLLSKEEIKSLAKCSISKGSLIGEFETALIENIKNYSNVYENMITFKNSAKITSCVKDNEDIAITIETVSISPKI